MKIRVGQVYTNRAHGRFLVEKKVLGIGKQFNYWRRDNLDYVLYEVLAGSGKGRRFICSLPVFEKWGGR
ncbi:MAG: hypothetical protein PHC60_05040 [Heliobacteriaceae bacterium]|nr:hypothetical protein [Heliobacteriaceae bacterium]MDD4587735.1 hypothetical protein [Heliobacteriaceae bacterium]